MSGTFFCRDLGRLIEVDSDSHVLWVVGAAPRACREGAGQVARASSTCFREQRAHLQRDALALSSTVAGGAQATGPPRSSSAVGTSNASRSASERSVNLEWRDFTRGTTRVIPKMALEAAPRFPWRSACCQAPAVRGGAAPSPEPNGIRLTAKQHSFKGSRGIPAQRAGFSRFRLWLQLRLPCWTSICWRVSGRGAGRSGSGAVAGGTRRCRRGSARRSCPAWRRAPGTALPGAAPQCAGCS